MLFRPRRSYKKKIIVGCIFLLIVGFIYGYTRNEKQIKYNSHKGALNNTNTKKSTLHFNNKEKKNEIQETDQEKVNGSTDLIHNKEKRVTSNTKIILKTYYGKTRDMLVKEDVLPNHLIGKSVDDLKAYLLENYIGWSIQKLNNNTAELYRAVNQVSPNHYMVRENHGYIGIFRLTEEGDVILVKKTNISTSSLSDIDKDKLQDGIIVKDLDEINQILEDYSS